MISYVVALLCVVGLAAGQILFKLSAISLSQTGSLFATKTASIFLAAMLLYALISLAWVWVLQTEDLGRVYPLMALAFVIVPLASHLIFGERFHTQYLIGVALIVAGIAVVVT